MTPLPFVVLANVQQHHGPVERRGNIGDRRLRDLDLIHAANADTAPRQRSTAEALTGMSIRCQQFLTIHNFHKFIHRPSTGQTPFEPPNLWACWELLWITLRADGPAINRLTGAERNGLPR